MIKIDSSPLSFRGNCPQAQIWISMGRKSMWTDTSSICLDLSRKACQAQRRDSKSYRNHRHFRASSSSSNREYATVAQYERSKGRRWTVRFRHTYKDRKTIQYWPASWCHVVGALFAAAQTERGNAQKSFTVSGRAATQNYFARGAIQNRTPCSCFTTLVKIRPIDSKGMKGS